MLPTLYKIGKHGRVEQWSTVAVDLLDGSAYVLSISGQVDGIMTRYRRDISEGKNIGRSNATTAYQQACKEAQSIFNKKIDSGYSEDPSGAVTLGYVLPMLALSYPERVSFVKWPMIYQQKLNGVRCLIRVIDGEVTFTSRKGKKFHGLRHLEDDILRLVNSSGMPAGLCLDGELYRHGVSLQRISSLVRSSKNIDYEAIRETIQFHMFDFVHDTASCASRMSDMHLWYSDSGLDSDVSPVQVVPYGTAMSEEYCDRLVDIAIDNGYEGIMLREPDSVYLQNYRSEHLLKYKKFIDAEFPIIGALQGTGTDAGCCIFQCVSDNGRPFRVRCSATVAERQEQWRNAHTLIGQLLTVKFQAYTIYGVPEFPVGLAIRDPCL